MAMASGIMIMFKSFLMSILGRGDIINFYIDFDGVMTDTISAICDLYNEDYRYYDGYEYIHPCEVNTWSMKELSLMKKKDLYKYFNQPRLFERLELMPEARESLATLHRLGHSTNIVTIGDKPNLRQKVLYLEDWLFRLDDLDNFIGIESNDMDKSSVDMSGGILIDDHPKNLESSNADIKICFGDEYDYNKDWGGIRCYNWTDVMDYLKEKELL